MKKSCLFLLSLVFVISQSFAQNDPAAKKVLDAVSAKVRSLKSIVTTFSIRQVTSKGKDNGTKTGQISVKGQKYLLKQGRMEVICDGTKTYNYDGNKTVTVAAAEEPGQTLTPQKILSGAYDKDFSYKLMPAQGNFNVIELRPLDARKNFQKVTVYVDKAKSLITKAVILDKSNNTLQVSFTKINTTTNLADNLFVFNKGKYPKDVEILD